MISKCIDTNRDISFHLFDKEINNSDENPQKSVDIIKK